MAADQLNHRLRVGLHVRTGNQTREHRSRWVTDDGFRVIPLLGANHNARRFVKFVTGLMKKHRHTREGQRFAMKVTRKRRASA